MRVAVLDDDEKMLPYYVEEIASAFQHFGQEAQVKSYPDAQSCLEEKENIDIIFMDIKLPQDNGITVAEQLLERDSKLGVVFFSNYDCMFGKVFAYVPFNLSGRIILKRSFRMRCGYVFPITNPSISSLY